MRNLYLSLAAIAVAASASLSAYAVTPRTEKPVKLPMEETFGTSDFSFGQVLEMPDGPQAISLKSARKADGNHSIEGTWTFQFGDYYYPNSLGRINRDYIAEIEHTSDNGDILFFTPTATNGDMPFSCPYTEGDTQLMFNAGRLAAGVGTTIFIYQEPYQYNWATKDMIKLDALVGTYNPEEDMITFPVDCGIAWGMYSNANPRPEYFQGYTDVWDFEGGYLKTTDAWFNIGEALFTDGWVLPGFGIDQSLPENQWYVPIQQHKLNKFLFRLVDPYHIGPFDPELGEDAIPNTVQDKVGYIQFDITDAKHVIFDKVDAAFGGGSGINAFNKFFCYNIMKWYMNFQNSSYEEAVMAFDLAPDFYPSTVFEDNTVKLTYVTREDGSRSYDANFGVAKNYEGEQAKGGLGCTTADGQPANMCAYIKFPDDYVYTAVESIFEDVDNAGNAPIEYFNLQGIRVANPIAGQLVIRKQGKKSEKIIF